jgi:glycosyltransferase involved in cell wall biosynthesis
MSVKRNNAPGAAAGRNAGKLNILFVSEYFHPRPAGGEIWSWELCTSLAAAGHKVTAITCRYDRSLKADETVKGVRILRPVAAMASIGRRLVRGFVARRLARQVKRYLDEDKGNVDLVHVMAYTMNRQVSRLAARRGIPCVTSVHSYFGDDWRRISAIGWVMKRVERKIISRDASSVMHVPSRYLHERIMRDTGKETIVIHDWLQESFPKPRRLPGGTCVFVGSLEGIKDPFACIPAVKGMRGARLIVIGKGSLEKEMRKRAAEAGIRCEFLGDITHEEALAYIGGASLVLVPSITESFSLVALEAVAQGTPVAGNPVGVLPELQLLGKGVIVPFPPKRMPLRLSKDLQEKVRREFSRESAVAQFEALYRRMREE